MCLLFLEHILSPLRSAHRSCPLPFECTVDLAERHVRVLARDSVALRHRPVFQRKPFVVLGGSTFKLVSSLARSASFNALFSLFLPLTPEAVCLCLSEHVFIWQSTFSRSQTCRVSTPTSPSVFSPSLGIQHTNDLLLFSCKPPFCYSGLVSFAAASFEFALARAERHVCVLT